MSTELGTIQYLLPDRGYGFVVPTNSRNGRNLFFHFDEFSDRSGGPLRVGEQIEFARDVDEKGRPRAVSVRRPTGAPVGTFEIDPDDICEQLEV